MGTIELKTLDVLQTFFVIFRKGINMERINDLNVIYSAKFKTSGAILDDGSKALIFEIMDCDTDERYIIPIPLDIANNICNDIIDVSKELSN